MKALCIGDSNTYGYDPRSFFGSRYEADVRWTERLGEWECINHGVNGQRIPREAKPYIDLIRSTAPDLVIVMLGANDLLEGLQAAEVAARMEAFLSALTETGAQIMLITPPPLCMGEWVQSQTLIEESEKLSVLYEAVAKRTGALFADAGEWNIDLAFDGVHFTSRGHAAFAAALKKVLCADLK